MADPVHLFAFSLDGVRLALPLDATGMALPACEVAPLPGAPASVLGVINLRGDAIAVLDLRARLRLAARIVTASDYFVTVQVPGRTVVLVATDVEGAIDVPAAAISQPPDHAANDAPVRGLVTLADGLLLIEEPSAFLAPEEMQLLERSLEAAGDR